MPADLTVAGWGTTENGKFSKHLFYLFFKIKMLILGATSDILLKADLAQRSLDVCKSLFRDYADDINDSHLCVGGNTRSDSCDGDSGGPLFAAATHNGRTRIVQYALVSFGVAQCGAIEQYPAVYTNIVKQLPWISNNIA